MSGSPVSQMMIVTAGVARTVQGNLTAKKVPFKAQISIQQFLPQLSLHPPNPPLSSSFKKVPTVRCTPGRLAFG
ncbi:hypothetical protein STEG23_004022, partial [Scotinomys teguina]